MGSTATAASATTSSSRAENSAASPTSRCARFGLPEVIVDGEVIEVKPPFKLVQTYRFLFNEEHKKEGFTRITFEIEQTAGGFCRLTVTHDTAGAPMMARGHAVQLQRPTAVADGTGSSATSSRCWRPARSMS